MSISENVRTSRRQEPVEHPDSHAGWKNAAIAICSILQIPAPMLLRLIADDLPPLYIDFRFRAFDWPLPMDQFPTAPSAVEVETESTPQDSPPLFELPGRNLDSLLWSIGTLAFDGERASWLRPDERYRLRRWPNLTELVHTIDQMRMVSMLGTAFYSAEELATASNGSVESAQDLINALSLMGLLQVSEEAPEPPMPAPVAPEMINDEAPSLFKRLRERLGL